jgi:Secretion system C-terminal sorting domain
LNQNLSTQTISVVNGASFFSLQSNAVILLEIALNELQITETNLSAFSCFPNPSEGVFTIQLNNNTSFSNELIVTNILGEVLLKQVVLETDLVLNLSEFSSGIYFLKLSGSGELKTLLVK